MEYRTLCILFLHLAPFVQYNGLEIHPFLVSISTTIYSVDRVSGSNITSLSTKLVCMFLDQPYLRTHTYLSLGSIPRSETGGGIRNMTISLFNKTQQTVAQSDFPSYASFSGARTSQCSVSRRGERSWLMTQEMVWVMSRPLSGENATRTGGSIIDLKQSAFPITAEKLWRHNSFLYEWKLNSKYTKELKLWYILINLQM